MKNIFNALLFFLIISCTPEDQLSPNFQTNTYSAKIGDTVTLKGENLSAITNITFGNQSFSASTTKLESHRFLNQSDNEIRFILPEFTGEKIQMNAGGHKLMLDVKGFIPLDIFDIISPIYDIQIIDEKSAIISTGEKLYLLYDGFYKKKLLSSATNFFGAFENGDSWYIIKNQEAEIFQVYFKSSNEDNFSIIKEFESPIPYYNSISDMIFTQDMDVLINIKISSESRKYFVIGNEVKELKDIIPNLPDIGINGEFEVYKFLQSPNGEIYCRPNYASDYLVLDLNNKSFRTVKNLGGSMDQVIDFYKNSAFDISKDSLGISRDFGKNWIYENVSLEKDFLSGYRGTTFNTLDSNTLIICQNEKHINNDPYSKAYISINGGLSWEEEKTFKKYQEAAKADFAENTGLVFMFSTHFYSSHELYKYVR